MTRHAVLVFGLLTSMVVLAACEEKKKGFVVGQTTKADQCDLNLGTLAGTEWIMLKVNPDKTELPDSKARMKWFEEGGKQKVKYNVGSVADMYTYDCVSKEGEVACREEPKVKDWCQALEAGGTDCTAESIKGIDPTVTDAAITEGLAKAREVIDRYKGKPDWEKFKMQNNNLGNKLQGLLYVRIDDRNCRLRITDNYMTIYDGKRIEDSNPVGTNPFVKNDQGELLWEHCENRDDLIARPEAEYPADPDKVGHSAQYAVGKDVNLWYLAKDAREYKEGCEHSFDVWLDGKPVEKGIKPEVAEVKRKKELRWHYIYRPTAASDTGEGDIVTFVRSTTCEGQPAKKHVSCAAVLIR